MEYVLRQAPENRYVDAFEAKRLGLISDVL
jgi:hypothetical protein